MNESTTADRLKAIMHKRKLKQVDILRMAAPYCKRYKIHLGKSDVSQFVNGKVKPGNWKLTILALALDVSEGWLMGLDVPMERDELPEDFPNNLVPLRPRNSVPLVGAVAAGSPILAETEYDTYIDVPDGRIDFALRIEGDSMKPTFLHGDVIFVRQTDDVSDGTIAVVILDDTATVKHVYHIPNGLLLLSDNQSYPPMRMTFDEYSCIRIFGVVVGYQRMLL